jgi:hypothetical protein
MKMVTTRQDDGLPCRLPIREHGGLMIGDYVHVVNEPEKPGRVVGFVDNIDPTAKSMIHVFVVAENVPGRARNLNYYALPGDLKFSLLHRLALVASDDA